MPNFDLRRRNTRSGYYHFDCQMIQPRRMFGRGTSQEQVKMLLDFCKTPRSRKEMQELLGIEGRKAFNNNYLKPLLAEGKLKMTIPDKPNSRSQKYITVK